MKSASLPQFVHVCARVSVTPPWERERMVISHSQYVHVCVSSEGRGGRGLCFSVCVVRRESGNFMPLHTTAALPGIQLHFQLMTLLMEKLLLG